jgi:CRP-like cAMP-binding protein
MSDTPDVMALMVRKLETRAQLSDEDRSAIMALPFVRRTYDAPSYLLREGEPSRRYCSFVVSGLAFRQKLAVTGARQIVSVHVRGDLLDLQHLFLSQADHSIQALTRLETADIDRSALRALILARPKIGEAMWTDALIDASIFREWVLNVGRRDARARVAHLLCEFALRLQAAGLAGPDGAYELPMTQEQLGDSVGLTPIHINRTLKALAAERLIGRDRRKIWFDDWERLREAADFSAIYLHLGETVSEEGPRVG